MMSKKQIAFACAALTMEAWSGFAVAQSKLNAPLPSSAPTIGSEIKRGADAGDRCSSLHVMPTNSNGFANCIDQRQSSNRQAMGNGYEAFDVGLYYIAKTNMSVAINILRERNYNVDLLQSRFNLYDLRYQQARDKLNLTDSEAESGALIGW